MLDVFVFVGATLGELVVLVESLRVSCKADCVSRKQIVMDDESVRRGKGTV